MLTYNEAKEIQRKEDIKCAAKLVKRGMNMSEATRIVFKTIRPSSHVSKQIKKE